MGFKGSEFSLLGEMGKGATDSSKQYKYPTRLLMDYSVSWCTQEDSVALQFTHIQHTPVYSLMYKVLDRSN